MSQDMYCHYLFAGSCGCRYNRDMIPTLAVCNIFGSDGAGLAAFAREHEFSGIDWTIDPDLPEDRFRQKIAHLADFEVRYHCRFFEHEIALPGSAGVRALNLYKEMLRRIQAVGGQFMTLHIGLGRPANEGLDLASARKNLRELVTVGRGLGITVCLENLADGWTSDAPLFNRLVGETAAGITVDIGHAPERGSDSGTAAMRALVAEFPERVHNSHIYHREVPGNGHTPPQTASDLRSRLHLLGTRTPCCWWVIELQDPDEILHTRDLIMTCLHETAPPVDACLAV